jgi:hypothetical protein
VGIDLYDGRNELEPTTGYLIQCDADWLEPSAGQTILFWTKGGVTYTLGLTGDVSATRDVLSAIANSVVLWSP